MFNNDKGGSAYLLIYGLFFLFACGILFVAYNQVNTYSIRPILDNPDMNFTSEDKAEADSYLGLWNFMPYMLIFVAAAFFIIHIGIVNS